MKKLLFIIILSPILTINCDLGEINSENEPQPFSEFWQILSTSDSSTNILDLKDYNIDSIKVIAKTESNQDVSKSSFPIVKTKDNNKVIGYVGYHINYLDFGNGDVDTLKINKKPCDTCSHYFDEYYETYYNGVYQATYLFEYEVISTQNTFGYINNELYFSPDFDPVIFTVYKDIEVK